MSVCICVISKGGHDNKERIVFVEDRKVSFTDFSADKAVTKSRQLARNCWVQFAGNDAEKAPLVIENAQAKIGGHPPETWSPELMAKLLQAAWLECRDEQIGASVLRKHGFTFESFREHGREKCSESVYDQLHDRIDRFKFSLEFLVAGFDVDGVAHICHLDSQGSVSSYDDLGFWAIGSGAHAALSSLSFHVERDDMCTHCSCVHQTAYFACEAKFMAETDVRVGKESAFLSIHQMDEQEPQFFFQDEMETIKKRWLKYGAPKPSNRVMAGIYELMSKLPSKRVAEARGKRAKRATASVH